MIVEKCHEISYKNFKANFPNKFLRNCGKTNFFGNVKNITLLWQPKNNAYNKYI